MLRGILTVGGWTMGSRILGFLRDMLMAALVGAGPLGDAFVVANRLPNMFRSLFGEGAFNAAFVPEFSAILTTRGPDAARRFAEQTFGVMAFWLLGLTLLAEALMPQIMALLQLGADDNPAHVALVVELARITFPYMPLICLTALLSGVLNGLDRFAAAAAAPIVYNLTSMAFMIGLIGLVPTAGHALAWGVSASGVFQLGLVAWATWRAGMALHLVRPRLSPEIRVLLRRMAPGLLAAGVTQLNLSLDVVIASFLPPGTQSALYYANRLNQLPLGIIGTAIGTAMLPSLSRQVIAGEAGVALTTLNRALEYALVLTLPAALALATVPGPIMSVLFERGAFDHHAAVISGQTLAAYAVGLPAFVLIKVLVPALFARGDTTTPMRWGLASVVLNILLNIAFMHPLQHMGPALAASCAAWFNVAALVVVLQRRGYFAPDAALKRRVPRMALAALAMVLALLVLRAQVFAPLSGHGGLRWLGLALLVGGGGLAYGVCGEALGAFHLRDLLKSLRRRAPRPA
jgi:putative peptidoglycan lipid II flippase